MSAGVALAFEAVAQSVRSLRNDGFVRDEVPKKDREKVRTMLGRLAWEMWDCAGVRACRVCGCTEDDACGLGCSWVGQILCSACAPKKKRGRK